jgi:hypothetical protein
MLEGEIDVNLGEIMYSTDSDLANMERDPTRISSNKTLNELFKARESITVNDEEAEILMVELFESKIDNHPLVIECMDMIENNTSGGAYKGISVARSLIKRIRGSDIPISLQFFFIVSLVTSIMSRAMSLRDMGKIGQVITLLIGFVLLFVMNATHAPLIMSVSVLAATIRVGQRVMSEALRDANASPSNALILLVNKVILTSNLIIVASVFVLCGTNVMCISVTAFLRLLV